MLPEATIHHLKCLKGAEQKNFSKSTHDVYWGGPHRTWGIRQCALALGVATHVVAPNDWVGRFSSRGFSLRMFFPRKLKI
jgi:hypothetical protein